MRSNFRKPRPIAGSGRSVDGFVRSPGAHHTRANTYRPVAANRRVGDFKATDGFHSARPARHIGQPMTLPAVADAKTVTPTPSTHTSPRKHTFSRRNRGPADSESKRKRFTLGNPFKRSAWTKKRVKRTAAAFAALLILIGGGLGLQAYLKFNQIFKGGGGAAALEENVDPSKLRGEGDGRVNMLLLGRGGFGHEGADLTDTILIASIDPIQKEATLLSIPRDLYVQTSSGGYTKLNSVFALAKEQSLYAAPASDKKRVERAENAGFKAVEDIVQSKIGIPIHYHAIIDFAGFRKAIDTVGGVDINVAESGTVYEVMRLFGKQYVLSVHTGRQHFDGLRALAYSRSRYTSARGDFDRSERQRMILTALKSKVVSAGTFGNPIRISRLMNDFGNHIRANLNRDEVLRLYEIGRGIPNGKITSLGLADPPNNYLTTDMINGQSVVVPRAGVDNYSEIQNFIRNKLRDGFLRKENARVMILNGTSIPGLASRTAENLRSFGYTVAGVSDAPTQTYAKTILVDLRSGSKKYTRRYLENRLDVKALTRLPDTKIRPGSADFVIILGQNEQARLAN